MFYPSHQKKLKTFWSKQTVDHNFYMASSSQNNLEGSIDDTFDQIFDQHFDQVFENFTIHYGDQEEGRKK